MNNSQFWEEFWEEMYPDRDERAEARKRFKETVQRYDPKGVEYDGDPETGFAVLVKDQAGGINDFWVDVWIDKADVDVDWNDIVRGYFYDSQKMYILQQDDSTVADSAFDAAVRYLTELGLIVQLPNGDWRYANPDEYAVRRDAVVSLARKARANRAKGVGKITGRFRF